MKWKQQNKAGNFDSYEQAYDGMSRANIQQALGRANVREKWIKLLKKLHNNK